MNNSKISVLNRIWCWIIGWNPDILKECGESSFRALRRYVSSIIIVSILWGTIGWCFAERYIGIGTWYGKVLVSIAFITIIISIERYIILHVGKLGYTKAFRIILAICMAVLGSTIFDQIIFKNDVELVMKNIRTEKANEEIPRRMILIEREIKAVSSDIDSLDKVNAALYMELQKKPMFSYTDVNTESVPILDQFGKPIYDSLGHQVMTTKTITTKRNVENPNNSLVKSNELVLAAQRERLAALQEQKLTLEKDVRKEFNEAAVGFLEELTALFKVISGNIVALIFYIFLFVFMFSLELLVLTSKGDDKCDYDLIVEHQNEVKRMTLERTRNELVK